MLPTAGLAGQRGQIQPDRPTLGPPDQLGHLRGGELDPGTLQQRPGLPLVHGQLVDPDLNHLALGTEPRHPDCALAIGYDIDQAFEALDSDS